MDASLLSTTNSLPWYIALVDELVDGLHQNYPDANWTHLPPLTSEVSVAKPQVLYARAACSTSSAQGNGNSNTNGNTNSNGNSSPNTSDSSKPGGNNTVLIGAVAGAVGGCLLLAGIIFFFYRRRVKRKHAAPPAPTANPTLLDSTPMSGGKAQPMQFQGGPIPLATPPSTYVASSAGDSSSNYNPVMPLSPQWTGMTGATSTYLGHPPPPSSSHHPSSYYTTSSPGPHPMPSPAPSSNPPPWAVPMDPNSQASSHAYLSPPNVAPGPNPLPGTEKAQFSGYPNPVHQNALPAWAVDHKRPGASPGPSNVPEPSGSGSGRPLSNVLDQPGDALPPPAYTATPSSL